ATILLFARVRLTLVWITLAAVMTSVIALAPEAAFKRMQLNPDSGNEYVEGNMNEEARVRVFTGIIEGVNEFWLGGVGAGDYWKFWAFQHKIISTGGGVAATPVGAHNCYLQVWINWGLPGVIAFCILVFTAYKCLPRRSRHLPI